MVDCPGLGPTADCGVEAVDDPLAREDDEAILAGAGAGCAAFFRRSQALTAGGGAVGFEVGFAFSSPSCSCGLVCDGRARQDPSSSASTLVVALAVGTAVVVDAFPFDAELFGEAVEARVVELSAGAGTSALRPSEVRPVALVDDGAGDPVADAADNEAAGATAMAPQAGLVTVATAGLGTGLSLSFSAAGAGAGVGVVGAVLALAGLFLDALDVDRLEVSSSSLFGRSLQFLDVFAAERFSLTSGLARCPLVGTVSQLPSSSDFSS